MNDHALTSPAPLSVAVADTAESAAPAKTRKPRQNLTTEQYREAADMLAAGHRRQDVAAHCNIHWTTLYARVPVSDVQAAKERRAQRIADGLEVLPEVVREKARKVRTDKPVREKVVHAVRQRGEALMKMNAAQRIEAADMLAAGHLRRAVGDHFAVTANTTYNHVSVADVIEAKARRAQRIADGLEVTPEVVRAQKPKKVHIEKLPRIKRPAAEKPAPRKRGEALCKISPEQRIQAADMIAAKHLVNAVQKHFKVTSKTLRKWVPKELVAEAQARRAARIAAGLDVMPEVAFKKAAPSQAVQEERQQDKQRNQGRRAAIKAYDKLKAKQKKNIDKLDAQYLALSEQMVALRAGIAKVEGELAEVRHQRRVAELSLPALDLSAFNKPVTQPPAPAPLPVAAAPIAAPVDEPVTAPARTEVINAFNSVPPAPPRVAKRALSQKVVAADDELPLAMQGTTTLPVIQHTQPGFLRPVAAVDRPTPPNDADLILVPLTAASNTAMLRQQHQPPLGWTPSELWNGFIALNTSLRDAHKKADVTDPLIDRMMRRFAIQRHTPESIAAEGDDFIREHRAEKFPGLVREVFLLVSHKKHHVIGEVWQDHKAGSPTPETVFVLDPALTEKPKVDNLFVLVPNDSGKGQKYRSFTPTRLSRSPEA